MVENNKLFGAANDSLKASSKYIRVSQASKQLK